MILLTPEDISLVNSLLKNFIYELEGVPPDLQELKDKIEVVNAIEKNKQGMNLVCRKCKTLISRASIKWSPGSCGEGMWVITAWCHGEKTVELIDIEDISLCGKFFEADCEVKG